MFKVYILKTADDRYYVGSTADLKARLQRHQRGECRFTKSKLPVTLVYSEPHSTRGKAMRREKRIKAWKSSRRIAQLISSDGGPIV